MMRFICQKEENAVLYFRLSLTGYVVCSSFSNIPSYVRAEVLFSVLKCALRVELLPVAGSCLLVKCPCRLALPLLHMLTLSSL